MADQNPSTPQRSDRRGFMKGVMILGGTPYALSRAARTTRAAPESELFDRLESQIAYFDDLLSTVDDALLVDYRREQLEALSDTIEAADAPKGLKKQLRSKVSAALDSNERAGEYAVEGDEAGSEENQDATDGQLTSFLNSVESQSGKKLDESTGSEFAAYATNALEARQNPLVRADDIQDRDAPTSSAFVSNVEDSFEELRKTVTALKDKGYEVNLNYFHENGPAINVNPLFTVSLGLLTFATVGGLKATAGYLGFKALAGVTFLTLSGWAATHQTTALQLVQRFYTFTPNYRLLAARYMLDEAYEDGLEDMQDQIEGGDSALENAIEELASRVIGGLIPRISEAEAGVLLEYITELPNQFVNVTVVEHHLCPTIENESHRSGFDHDHSHNCVGERYEYTSDDEYVYSWSELADVPPGTTVSWTWTAPSGDVVVENSLGLPDPRDEDLDLWQSYFVWMWVPIAGTAIADQTGEWTVEISINGESKVTDSFTLTS